jgi:hypothetical protein
MPKAFAHRDLRPDAAHANDQRGFPPQFNARKLPVPHLLLLVSDVLVKVPAEVQQHRHGVVGDLRSLHNFVVG